jgi:hypothetical protein
MVKGILAALAAVTVAGIGYGAYRAVSAAAKANQDRAAALDAQLRAAAPRPTKAAQTLGQVAGVLGGLSGLAGQLQGIFA